MRPDIQLYSPFRRPDWRLSRILHLMQGRPNIRRCSRHDDDDVRAARDFLIRWLPASNRERVALRRDEPGLAKAWEIYERAPTDATVSYLIQARILARQCDEEIAKSLSLVPDAIRWYEALFFSVRDRIDCSGWIYAEVIHPALERRAPLVTSHARRPSDTQKAPPGEPISAAFLDAGLKRFAYYGGPLLVDFMLQGLTICGRVVSPAQIDEWLQRAWTASVRWRSLMAMALLEMSNEKPLEMVKLHSRIFRTEKRCEAKGLSRDETGLQITEGVNAGLRFFDGKAT